MSILYDEPSSDPKVLRDRAKYIKEAHSRSSGYSAAGTSNNISAIWKMLSQNMIALAEALERIQELERKLGE